VAAEFHSESRGRKMRGRCPDDREYLVPAIWREASGRRWGRFAVARRHSATPCTRSKEIKRPATSNFYVGVLCMLAIVVSVVIGVAATVALGKNPLGPDRVLANAADTLGSADDYVED
jgi:hypothetical protein